MTLVVWLQQSVLIDSKRAWRSVRTERFAIEQSCPVDSFLFLLDVADLDLHLAHAHGIMNGDINFFFLSACPQHAQYAAIIDIGAKRPAAMHIIDAP